MDRELIKEARGYVCNAIAAYAEAFDLMNEEDLDKEFFTEVVEVLTVLESMMPMFKTLWEIDKKDNPDESFLEFITKFFEKRG